MLISKILNAHVLCEIVGLALTIAGALINTRGAMIEGEDAKKVAHTAGDPNEALELAMQDQSRSAKSGFRLIAVGSCLQIFATLLQALG